MSLSSLDKSGSSKKFPCDRCHQYYEHILYFDYNCWDSAGIVIVLPKYDIINCGYGSKYDGGGNSHFEISKYPKEESWMVKDAHVCDTCIDQLLKLDIIVKFP